MASIAAELKTYLKTISGVTDLVGAGVAARIYLHHAKQSVALPYIVYEVYPGRSAETLAAIGGAAMNRVEINAYGATAAAAYNLGEAIRLAPLQMFRGTMGSTFVHSVKSDGGYDQGTELIQPGGNKRRYFVRRDYLITYTEPTS